MLKQIFKCNFIRERKLICWDTIANAQCKCIKLYWMPQTWYFEIMLPLKVCKWDKVCLIPWHLLGGQINIDNLTTQVNKVNIKSMQSTWREPPIFGRKTNKRQPWTGLTTLRLPSFQTTNLTLKDCSIFLWN